MNRRITWQAVIGMIIVAAVAGVIVFDVPRFIVSWMTSGWVPSASREALVTAAVAVLGAAIATRHWLAPVLLATAFLLLRLLGRMPTKTTQMSQLLMVGVTELAILLIVIALLLASLVLIVRALVRWLPPRRS